MLAVKLWQLQPSEGKKYHDICSLSLRYDEHHDGPSRSFPENRYEIEISLKMFQKEYNMFQCNKIFYLSSLPIKGWGEIGNTQLIYFDLNSRRPILQQAFV